MGRFFISVKTAVVLLMLIAALMVLGTIIPQGLPESEYLERYPRTLAKAILLFGLYDVYRCWWFVAALLLLALSLFVCFIYRIWRSRSKEAHRSLGLYLVHLGLLGIVLGGLLTALLGFRGYMEVEEGHGTDLVGAGKLKFRLPFEVHCERFEVEFWPNGTPKDFVSYLTFKRGEETLLEGAKVRVNHPISFHGFTFYQSSYGRSQRVKLEIDHNGESLELSLSKGEFLPLREGLSLGVMKLLGNPDEIPRGAYLVLFGKGPPKGIWIIGEGEREVEGIRLNFKGGELRYWTGLQVSRDPGAKVVFAGGVLALFGLLSLYVLPGSKGRGDGRS